MAKQTVADFIADTLHSIGVRRIYRLVGDPLNRHRGSLRRKGQIDWVNVRHQESAAFAGADAHLRREFAVCAGSCGPANTQLMNGP